jgi:2Fe-2S ferredoxin
MVPILNIYFVEKHMGNIIFVEHDGQQHCVDIEEGKSLMQVAMDNGVPGVDADCGGECACGTCHVIIEPNWISKMGTVTDDEQQMLDMTPERSETSRLACQIEATQDMDGMVVRLPEFQM